ncbi:MAG: hypothetical protein EU539_05205 [Promethearchaeota archaeon]|nr:MAG: hypothetical protein EU539_05205 [Candidatus Lokiarchaeota archaeon]
MFKSKFEKLENYLKNKKVLITAHDSVDLDAFVSCFLFKLLLKSRFENEISIFFSKLSNLTKDFIGIFNEKFPNFVLSFNENKEFPEVDVIFILDTNNLEQVEIPDKKRVIGSQIPFIFIDHHIEQNRNYTQNITSLNIINNNITSTSEIILELCEYFGFELELPHKFLLVAGILSDTGHLKYANNNTIQNLSKLLLDERLDLQDVVSSLEFEEDISEKIARLKGLQRLNLMRVKDWLIGITHVGSFESSLATLLINIGCDISIVYSHKKLKNRITMRGKRSTCHETGLNLGKLLEEVSTKHGISGGGHECAASLNGEMNSRDIVEEIKDKIKQILNK